MNLQLTHINFSIHKKYILIVILFNLQEALFAQQPICYDKLTNVFYSAECLQIKNVNSAIQSPDLFNWQMVQSPTIQLIKDIEMLDSRFGFISYYEGLSQTTNGGLDWQSIYYSPNAEMNAIDFLNIDTGWYVGGRRIRITTNRGLDWSIKDYPPFGSVPNYYSVYFRDYNTGFVAGERDNKSYIIVTTNCGTNWQQIYSSLQINSRINQQYWVNNNIGWFLGGNTLLRTTDGGVSLQDCFTNLPSTSNSSNSLLGMCFINENTGWISGSNIDHKNMYKTTNGGENWVFQDNPVTQYEFAQLDDVLFIDENRGWAGGYSGQIITTTNGGINWITDVIAPTWFVCFANYGYNKVWCGANNGEVWYIDSVPPISVTQNGVEIPEGYALKQNYPNPFNSQTTIEFEIPLSQMITIKIFNSIGKEVKNLLNQVLEAGKYKINFSAEKLTSGVYFYRLEADDFTKSLKFVLIK